MCTYSVKFRILPVFSCATLVVFLFPPLLHAEVINLTGVVQNIIEQPVVAAQVSLQSHSLSTTTDSGGTFILTLNRSNVVTSMVHEDVRRVTLQGATLRVGGAVLLPFTVILCCIDGRVLFSAAITSPYQFDAGIPLPLQQMSKGIYLLSLKERMHRSVYRFLHRGDTNNGYSSLVIAPTTEQAVSQSQSAAVVADTLTVTANGYRIGSQPVSSYSVNSILITLVSLQSDNATTVIPTVTSQGGSGNVTTYGSVTDPGVLTCGACGCDIPGIRNYAAINVNLTSGDQLGSWQCGRACGRCARVNVYSSGGWRSTTVRILDKCADDFCGIDLGGAPALAVMGEQAGRYFGTWEWVSCEGVEDVSSGPAHLYVKEGSNASWSRVQVRNGKSAVDEMRARSVTDSTWVALAMDPMIEGYHIVPGVMLTDDAEWDVAITWEMGSESAIRVQGSQLSVERDVIALQ